MVPTKNHRGLVLVSDQPSKPDQLIVVEKNFNSQPNERNLRMVRKFEDRSGIPEQYLFRSLRFWRDPMQTVKSRDVKGWVIFHHLQQAEKNTPTSTLNLGSVPMDSCLGFSDAVAIAKYPEMFHQVLGSKAITCWKAVAEDSKGCRYILNIFYFDGEIVFHWRRLDLRWTASLYTVHHERWEDDEE